MIKAMKSNRAGYNLFFDDSVEPKDRNYVELPIEKAIFVKESDTFEQLRLKFCASATRLDAVTQIIELKDGWKSFTNESTIFYCEDDLRKVNSNVVVNPVVSQNLDYKFVAIPNSESNPLSGSTSESITITNPEAKEEVNHPKHYNKGNIEVIEFIKDQGLLHGFCLGNVIKYACRYDQKDGLKDLKKAQWYLNYLIENLGE